MKTIVQNSKDEVRVAIQGRVDTVTSPQLAEDLKDVDFSEKNVVLDFTDVEYISSAGLRELLVIRKKAGNGSVSIENVSPDVSDILETTGFTSMFEVTQNMSGTSYLQKSFKQILKDKSAERGDAVFLKDEKNTYTWKDVEMCSQIIADDLRKLGVKKGSHVGICSVNSVNWLLTFFAVQKLGAIACLMNFGYNADEIATVAKTGDIEYFCYGEITTMQDADAFLKEVQEGGSPIREVYDIRKETVFKDRENEYEAVRLLYGETVEADDACVMIYTSGSTGVPKGVLLSSYNILNAANTSSEIIHVTEEDRLCMILPLFHIFGITVGLFATVLGNGQIVIPENLHTSTLLSTIEREQCTMMHSVPTMLLALMNSRSFRPEAVRSLRAVVLGGAPLSKAQLLQMVEVFGDVHFISGYGLSEMTPVSLTLYGDSVEKVSTTVGKPLKNIRVMIQDPSTGKECREGDVGEVLVEGYNLMVCYYKAKLENQAIDDTGWLHTGDLGFFDGDGYLHITGRIKELIIRGGENIMPVEIEGVISRHPDVENVKVVGVPDVFYGESVCACLVMKPGKTFDEEEMKEFLSDKVAKYKIPVFYMIFDEFPKLSSGKMDSVKIRKLAGEKYGDQGKDKA